MIILGFKKLLEHPVFLAVLLLPTLFYGQETQFYKGPLQVGNYRGEAAYDYNIVNNDTLFDGSFRIQRSNLEALVKKEDVSFSIQGNFEKNIPTGSWKFQFNTFQSNSKSTVQDYQYVVNVSGMQRMASGVLKKGKPDGKWICTTQQIENSEIDKIKFKSVISFDNGIPQQSFTIENEQQELVGRFLRNGVAHDEWTLFSDKELNTTESWFFNEGLLESITSYVDGKTREIKIHSLESQNETKIISLDTTYLEILKIKLLKEDSKKISNSGMIGLLGQNDRFYQDINRILSNLSTASFSPKFKVKIPYFPIDQVARTTLDAIVDRYKKSREISDALLNNTQLTILKLSDENVRSSEESIQVISDKILDPLERFEKLHTDKMLSYISREELISKIWPNGIPDAKSIKNTTSKELKYKLTNATNALDAVDHLTKETLKYLGDTKKILESKIIKREQEQEAIALEKKMIAQRNYLDELTDSLLVDTIPMAYVNTLQNLKKSIEEKLSTYSSIKSAQQKLEYAKELVYCFEKQDQVGKTIAMLPKQQYAIKSKYQDAVWNPFTATIMNELIKKKLIAAYENVLIPFFLKKIEEGLPCEKTEHWINLVNTTYDRMVTLRDKDTRKLERKLKKEENPQLILEYLKIESQIKMN